MSALADRLSECMNLGHVESEAAESHPCLVILPLILSGLGAYARRSTRSAVWGDLGASWPSHPSARHDLLHLYNSDATPLPTLRVEVWRSAMRVLDDLLG